MQEMKLSIIIPIYNAEKYLEKCLDSVISQTYENLQIIVVDDGSTDGSPIICDDYAKRDGRVQVIHKANGGSASARNRGLDNAKGELIGFVDSDDCIMPSMYATLIDNLIKNDADISACGRIRCIEGKTQDCCKDNIIHVYDNSQAFYELFGVTRRLRPAVWDKVYKRELFDGVRFPDNYYEDVDVTVRLIGASKKVVYTEAQLYKYLIHEDSKIASAWKKEQLQSYYEINQMLEAFFVENMDYNNLYNSYIWRIEFSIEAFERIMASNEIMRMDRRKFMKFVRQLCKISRVLKLNVSVKKKIRYFVFPYIPRLSNKLLHVSYD